MLQVKEARITNKRNVLVQVPSFIVADWEVEQEDTIGMFYDQEAKAVILKPAKFLLPKKAPKTTQYEEESKLLEDVLKWLKPQQRDGIKVIRICDRYAKGYSDLFLSVYGWFVVAELKDKDGTSSPHQKEFIRDMKATGAIGGVCRTVEDVVNLVNKAKRRALGGLEDDRTGDGSII